MPAQAVQPSAKKQNASHYDATSGAIELTGTIVRENKTTKDTQAAWSAVVYWLVLDNSVTITYKDFVGGETTNTFSLITVLQLEQYESKADVGLESISDPGWQAHIGETVTVSGEVIDTGNSHTFGYAKLKDPRLVA